MARPSAVSLHQTRDNTEIGTREEKREEIVDGEDKKPAAFIIWFICARKIRAKRKVAGTEFHMDENIKGCAVCKYTTLCSSGLQYSI